MASILERGLSIWNRVFPCTSLRMSVLRELKDCETVLDLGCGTSSVVELASWVRHSVGVDTHEESISECERRGVHSEYFRGSVFDFDTDASSFEAVIAIDVIEHMDRDGGRALLDKMEYWSSKKVILTTPNGWLPQDEKEDNPLQRHLSAWNVDDFTIRGYTVRGLNGLKWLRKSEAEIRWQPRIFWKLISDLSQVIVRSRPGIAFHILAVKEISWTHSYQ